MRKVTNFSFLPRQHALAFVPGDFLTADAIAFAMENVCDFIKAGSNPSILKLATCAFDGNLRQLSDSQFWTNCQIVDIKGMNPGSKGVISTKLISTGNIVAVYFGCLVTKTCSDVMHNDNHYSVGITVKMSDRRQHHLVLVGGRHITGPAAFINDCRSQIQDSGVATPTDLDKVNMRLVHATICGIPVVFAMATKDIEPKTTLLLDYGIQFWSKK
jgi:hypothetical protein